MTPQQSIIKKRGNKMTSIVKSGLSNRVQDILRRFGLNTLEQIASMSRPHMLLMQRYGYNCLHEIRTILQKHNLKLKGE